MSDRAREGQKSKLWFAGIGRDWMGSNPFIRGVSSTLQSGPSWAGTVSAEIKLGVIRACGFLAEPSRQGSAC
jgi:hypothetical protein